MSHAFESARECKGIDSQGNSPTLGVGVGNFRGQNSMDLEVFYIIGKNLERRCPKWACITHLDI